MKQSVLGTIKKLMGPSELCNYDGFDTDLIVHINSILMNLAQMGIGKDGSAIKDSSSTWEDLVGDSKMLEGIKSYIYLKTKILFDPPASATILNAYQEEIKQFEWRMMITCDEAADTGKN